MSNELGAAVYIRRRCLRQGVSRLEPAVQVKLAHQKLGDLRHFIEFDHLRDIVVAAQALKGRLQVAQIVVRKILNISLYGLAYIQRNLTLSKEKLKTLRPAIGTAM